MGSRLDPSLLSAATGQADSNYCAVEFRIGLKKVTGKRGRLLSLK